MSNTCKHFFNLLKVELEDLKDDIEILEQRAAEDLKNRDLSNYVYQENLVVLENEKEAVNQALKDLSTFNPNGYENIAVFEDALCAHFQCQFKVSTIGSDHDPFAILAATVPKPLWHVFQIR